MFKMWRSQAPEPPFVYRMYEMLLEINPRAKEIIRDQLKAEYGVDPLNDAAQKVPPGAVPVPTGQQLVASHSPDMIFYPESPLSPGELPTGCSVRGTVGHEPMFQVTQSILEGRIQQMWTNMADAGKLPLGEHSHMLLALLDVAIASNCNEEYRAESQSLSDNKAKMEAQLIDLERRVHESQQQQNGHGLESFLFIPLEPYYLGLSHELMEMMLEAYFQRQPELVTKIMSGYKGARAYTHRLGPRPPDGSLPTDNDLVGPCPFKGGLRLQCGMTPTLAIVHIHGLLSLAKVTSTSEVFIFPHALVFASSDNGHWFDEITKNIRNFPTRFYQESNESWRTSGKKCEVNGSTVKHESCASFMGIVRRKGFTLYPLFSEDCSSSVSNV
jgi:hypothetical protein